MAAELQLVYSSRGGYTIALGLLFQCVEFILLLEVCFEERKSSNDFLEPAIKSQARQKRLLFPLRIDCRRS
eukprot:scaffold3690_cov97-Skeletonema_dohrnii-CCMP3373.AAC.1